MGSAFHDSHIPVVKTRDEETAKSCGPCARVYGWNSRFWLFRIIFEVSPFSDRIGLEFTNLHEKSLFGIGNTSTGATVDRLSRLLGIFAWKIRLTS